MDVRCSGTNLLGSLIISINYFFSLLSQETLAFSLGLSSGFPQFDGDVEATASLPLDLEHNSLPGFGYLDVKNVLFLVVALKNLTRRLG